MKKYIYLAGFAAAVIAIFALSQAIGVVIFSLVSSTVLVVYSILQGGPFLDFSTVTRLVDQYILVGIMLGCLLSLPLYWLFFQVRNTCLEKKTGLLEYSRLNRAPFFQLAAGLLAGVSIYLIIIGIIEIFELRQHFPKHDEMLEPVILQPGFLISLLGVGVIIPLVEELALRGLIFNRMREDLPITTALLLQAMVFSLLHLNPLQAGYAFIGGLLLGLAYLWTGSLLIPVIMHISWNSASVFLSYFSTLEPNILNMIAFILAGSAILALSMCYLKISSKKETVSFYQGA